MKGIAIAAVPGSFLIDFIPALKYVPSWFPGGGFKKAAAYWREVNRKVLELPFNHVHRQIVSRHRTSCFVVSASPSLAAELISALPEKDDVLLAEEIQVAQNVTAIAYVGKEDSEERRTTH